jgi:hypothetical protein
MTQTKPTETGGTEVTRFNALRHGMLSRYTVLPLRPSSRSSREGWRVQWQVLSARVA